MPAKHYSIHENHKNISNDSYHSIDHGFVFFSEKSK